MKDHIPRLIFSFALNGSYCSSSLKNELYIIVCCCSIPRLIISFALNGSYYCSRSFVVAVSLDPRSSIDNFFRSKRVILSLTLKERAIHVCLASLLRQYPSIDNFFRSKGVFTHLRFLFVLASSLACFFVYTLGEICGRSVFRTRNRTLHSPLCVFVLAASVGEICGRYFIRLLFVFAA